MPHRAKLNSATSFKWFNFREAVVPLSGWAWLVGPPISRPRRGWVISTRHRRRIGEPIGKACKTYYPIPLYFTDQYYCTHTLGCHLASCSSCIGSRLVDELPTMVGPYTLAKLLADILHSVQCETLKRKQDKKGKSQKVAPDRVFSLDSENQLRITFSKGGVRHCNNAVLHRGLRDHKFSSEVRGVKTCRFHFADGHGLSLCVQILPGDG